MTRQRPGIAQANIGAGSRSRGRPISHGAIVRDDELYCACVSTRRSASGAGAGREAPRSIRLDRLIASPLNCCAHISCAVCEPGRSRIGGTEPAWSSISSVLLRSGCTMRASAGSSAEAVAVRNGAIGKGR